MNIDKIKEGLGVGDKSISITKVSNGFNIRFRKTTYTGENLVCKKCGSTKKVAKHHIIARSAGGGEEEDNIIPLCEDHHTGDHGIHNHKFSIAEIVGAEKIEELKKRYGVLV